jgi:hypothetical protein
VGHRFDVLHLHEPTTASISAIALLLAEGPVVATFHTATSGLARSPRWAGSSSR